MENKSSYVFEINIKDLFSYVIRRLWLIILIGFISAAGAGYYSTHYITPIYTSSAKLYIISKQEGAITTWSDLQLGSSLAQDYMILVKSRPVTNEVIQRLKLNMSSNQLSGLINVYTPEDTRVLQISVSCYDRNLVKTLADTIAEVSSERMVTVMGIEKVNIVENAETPGGPSSPNIMSNIKLAGLGGILLTTAIIAVIYLMNDSLKTSEDIEKYLGLNTLGLIPLEAANKKKKMRPGKRKKEAA